MIESGKANCLENGGDKIYVVMELVNNRFDS